MEPMLLATKLHIPLQPHHTIDRAPLVDGLEQGVRDVRLILVAAPAGYGKTTLLARWARSSRHSVVWLSLGDEDDDLERLLRYLVAGWAKSQPAVADSPLGVLLGAMSPPMEAVLSAFINAASDAPEHLVFVLDDYHLIDDASIHEAVTFLLDHAPPTLHFVVASRGEPPLPLARYRARRQLLELRADDLQFSVDETADFLRQQMHFDVSRDEVVALHAQLEGWIAGLQLAALARQRRLSAGDQPVVEGRHRFIADYLSEQVLAQLPDDLRRFLLETSILDRLCGPLCDGVTERTDGQAMLEALERANVFLMPLDDQREWFRYHRLFAAFLHAELKRRYPDELAPLHRRAARWYLTQGLLEQATRHAVAGDDAAVVAQIAESYVSRCVLRGEINLLVRWVESVPDAWYSIYPTLGIAYVSKMMFTGESDVGIRFLNTLEQRLTPMENEEARRQLARVTAIRCIIACMQHDLPQAEMYAGRALRDLAEEDLSFRADTYTALGDTYREQGRWEEARGYYLKVLDLVNEPAHRLRSAHVSGALADLDLRRGHLRAAAAHWHQALAVIQEPAGWGSLPLPLTGWVYVRLGEILYERNERGEASELVARGLERAELGGDAQAMSAGYLVAARLALTSGDGATASSYLERARPLAEPAFALDVSDRFARLQVECWLAQGRLREVAGWAETTQRDATRGEWPASEGMHLALARALIARGDAVSVEQALRLLAHVLPAADAEGRLGISIEGAALQALGHWRRGEHARALTSLERALRMAEPEGYVRLFADLGLPMVRLLQEARARQVMPDYVATLLLACGHARSDADPAAEALPEPLSVREREVLSLLAAGLTNREIAETLVISAETVKKHTGSIYGKLGVNNRTEAAARARDLELLNERPPAS